MYLLGQHLRFELLDFIYHVLNVAESEALSNIQAQLLDRKQTPSYPPVSSSLQRLSSFLSVIYFFLCPSCCCIERCFVVLFQDVTTLLENAKKARRLNSQVFSVLRARSPNEEKAACLVKQSGTVVHRIKYPVTPSAFDNLPLKGKTVTASFL